MGAGIAKQIRNIYLEVYSQYKADLAAHGDLMLGCFSMAETKDGKIIFLFLVKIRMGEENSSLATLHYRME